MGSCTSKDTTGATLSPDAQRRRMVRQTSTQYELKKQLEDYHRRPPPELKFAAMRPAPIVVENPNVLPSERAASQEQLVSDRSINLTSPESDSPASP